LPIGTVQVPSNVVATLPVMLPVTVKLPPVMLPATFMTLPYVISCMWDIGFVRSFVY